LVGLAAVDKPKNSCGGKIRIDPDRIKQEQFAMKPKLTKTVLLRITPEELAQIEAKAAAEDRSISNCLRQLVKAGMSAAGSEQRATA
jgi:hypothetical protein